jgi:hypothetical protein
MRKFRAMFVISVAVTVIAGASWAVAVAAAWPPNALATDRSAAVASTGLAALLWTARWVVRDKVLCYLLDKAVSQRARPARTQPFRVVR